MELHRLPDGTVVTLRAIRPDDRARLQDSHARLSPESRYRRFMTAKPRLSATDARYLAEIDGRDHVAIVATLAGVDDDERIVGVARAIRVAGDAELADLAIVVGDAWQRQGLGRALLAALGEAARAQGIARLRASMLADNAPIHRLIASYAAGPVEHRRSGSIDEVEFALPPVDDGAGAGAANPAARAAA